VLFGESPAQADRGLRLDTPLLADGSRIDVAVSFGARSTERVAIVVQDDRSPLCAIVTPSVGVVAFRTRIQLSRGIGGSAIHAYARCAGVLQHASARIRLTAGGYGIKAPDSRIEAAGKRELHSSVKARTIGTVTKVVALVNEPPPRNGARTSSLRRRLVFAVNATPVAVAELGPCAASNCFVGITIDGRLVGNDVSVHWTDSDGVRGGAETVVA
jgi:hypothetical protein